MSLFDRDYIRGKHSATCTCFDCTNQRLSVLKNNQNKHTNKVRIKIAFEKTSLILLAFICIGLVTTTIYLLHNDKIAQIAGIILIILTTLAIIWIIFSLKKIEIIIRR